MDRKRERERERGMMGDMLGTELRGHCLKQIKPVYIRDRCATFRGLTLKKTLIAFKNYIEILYPEVSDKERKNL